MTRWIRTADVETGMLDGGWCRGCLKKYGKKVASGKIRIVGAVILDGKAVSCKTLEEKKDHKRYLKRRRDEK